MVVPRPIRNLPHRQSAVLLHETSPKLAISIEYIFSFFEKSFGGVDEQFTSGSVMMRTELMERAAFLRIYKRVDLHFAADCTAEEILVGFCLDIYLLSKISSGGC